VPMTVTRNMSAWLGMRESRSKHSVNP
jgi:hypothetical protein